MQSTNTLALMPTQNEWDQIKEIANVAVKSGLLPSAIRTPEAAAIIALKGRELGLSPMVAFSHINVIQGKPTMSAEIMLAYIYKEHPTAEIVIVERTTTKCVIKARRPNEKDLTPFTWDMDRAKRMQLDQKDNWKKQPETMLFWRTITEMKRSKFPEVLMGVDYSPEEIEESVKDVTPKIVSSPIVDGDKSEPIEVKKIKNFAPQTAEEAKQKNAELEAKKAKESAANPDDPAQERQVLTKKLIGLQKDLKLSAHDFTEEIKTLTGKKTTELTNAEIANLCTAFSARLNQKGESNVQSATV